MSPSERLYQRDGVVADLRADGRTRLQYRQLIVEYDPVPQASGSARVALGDTEVLVAIKGDVCENSVGKLVFSVDTSSPSLSVLRESDDKNAIQEENAVRAANLSRLFNDSFDVSQLSVAENRFSWTLYVDVLIINSSGNLFDVMSMAVRAALTHCRLPKVTVEEGEAVGLSVSDDPADLKSLSCSSTPVSLTFAVFDSEDNNSTGNDFVFVADPNSAEEASSDYLVSLGMNEAGQVCLVQKWASELSTAPSKPFSAAYSIIEQLTMTARQLSPSILSETQTLGVV